MSTLVSQVLAASFVGDLEVEQVEPVTDAVTEPTTEPRERAPKGKPIIGPMKPGWNDDWGKICWQSGGRVPISASR